MKDPNPISTFATRLGLVCLAVTVAACSTPTESAEPSAPESEEATVLDAVAPEARTVLGSGEPRSGGYWITWSSCGEDSRAATAAANGGREAGWIIVDDLISDPGVVLGGHTVTNCDEAVAILDASRTDALSSLARQLLTAMLNRLAGSESCGGADETIAVAGDILASQEYRGPEGDLMELDSEATESLERLGELLAFYNSGELCR